MRIGTKDHRRSIVGGGCPRSAARLRPWPIRAARRRSIAAAPAAVAPKYPHRASNDNVDFDGGGCGGDHGGWHSDGARAGWLDFRLAPVAVNDRALKAALANTAGQLKNRPPQNRARAGDPWPARALAVLPATGWRRPRRPR